MSTHVQIFNAFLPFDQDVESIEEVLEALAAEQNSNDTEPFIGAELTKQNGDSLSVAIGKQGWALTITMLNPDFEQYTSAGDMAANGEVAVMWDQVTSVPLGWFVPLSDAQEAVRIWLETGSRSDAITWNGDTSE